MTLDIIITQIGLGILLFFIINWIGRHSYSIGYMSISVFAKVEEAPAFNFLMRVLTPIVYLILTASILYGLNLDRFIKQFYLVNFYYLIFRLTFNLLTGRGLLLNWYRQFLYWTSILVISYFVYYKIIINRVNLLPDFTTLANELWIIILIFLFHVTNNIRLSHERTIKRKENYVEKKFNGFKNKYGSLIDSKVDNENLKALIYSILIIENFNRPKLARWIEYIWCYITKKPHTLGVMQFYSKKYITDKKSVELGIDKVMNAYKLILTEYKNGLKPKHYSEWSIQYDMAEVYNTGKNYSSDISQMWTEIFIKYYSETTDKLLK